MPFDGKMEDIRRAIVTYLGRCYQIKVNCCQLSDMLPNRYIILFTIVSYIVMGTWRWNHSFIIG